MTECQFAPKDTQSSLMLESLSQCVAISILVKVNNDLGNKVPGKAKLQLGPVGVK